MSTDKSKPLSPIKWLLGVFVFVAVVAGSITLGTWLGPSRPASAPAPGGNIITTVIFLIFGGFVAALGVAVYFAVMITNLFTFDFNRPYMPSYGRKLWLVNLVTGLFLQGGFALAISPVMSRLLEPILPPNLLAPISIFLPFIAAAILMIWWSPWAPLELKMIHKRMAALGITPEQVESAIPVGISNPADSSFKRVLVEQDMGLLWVEPQRLTYFGDSQSFNIQRDQVISIERKADAGATSSYFGAVQVIITYTDPDGGERRVRLHSEGDWTMTAKAAAMRDLADRLESWQASPNAIAVPPATGFEVR